MGRRGVVAGRRTCLVFGLVFLLLAAPVFAQRFTAAIRATVKDSTGAAIQGATVTVTGDETGYVRSATTNAAGLCSFPELSVGRYRLPGRVPHFKTSVLTGILLSVAEVRAIDLVLVPGELAEEVPPSMCAAVAVQTIGGEVAGLVTGEQVRELPSNGRNFLQLALMHLASARESLQHEGPRADGPPDRLAVSGTRPPPTSGRWTVSTTTTSAPTPHPLSSPPWTRSTSSRSTATATAPSSEAPPGPRSTSSPARHERVPRQRLLLRSREPGLVGLFPQAGRPAQGAD